MPAPPPNTQTRGPVQLREHFSDRDDPRTWARALNRIQSAIKLASAIVRGVPFLGQGGNYIANVSFSAGSNTTIQHGLNRPYQGFLALNARTGAAILYDAGNSSAALNASQITLHSTNTCQADIWVY